ncbi:histidine kinase [Synechococcus sp. PCC 7502]|uniref:sensor histidine kinase n=1 Tax=Synechococcus sp. PCC 7502 TaxID=1173263 RepID=UPI00029FC9F2|nr:HAMP domain-containing sensor histidine kinase [Synechococcus sp. PCC 7502]AFY73195.1 histidine kinase [Synechococcus sp. PCC 7502]
MSQPLSRSSSLVALILGLFIGVFSLEIATDPSYVMGYLYVAPILLANSQFRRSITFQLTGLAVILTLSNIWFPGQYPVQGATVINRIITVIALIVTGVLSDRNRQAQIILGGQQAQLQAQERLMYMREDFVSTLVHDLKTPLLGAIETLTALQNQQFGSIHTSQVKILDTVIRSHQNSLKLVETLLDVYRNEVEGLVLHLAPVNLVNLVEDVTRELIHVATNRRVYLSINYGASDYRKSLWVNGDPLQLRRVFLNLFTNAINHSPRGTKVEVVLEAESAYQVVKVIDHGGGIKLEEMPYLFQRFYQGVSDRQARGSGLGLYLARQIMEGHGGTIWAENHLPHGAIFGVRLPVLIHDVSLDSAR